MKKIYKYEGEYGIFEVNLKEKKIIRDELDREKIWADAQEDYINQQHINIPDVFNAAKGGQRQNLGLEGLGRRPARTSKNSASN